MSHCGKGRRGRSGGPRGLDTWKQRMTYCGQTKGSEEVGADWVGKKDCSALALS